MCTKFLSKVLSYEIGRGKLLSLSPGGFLLCSPVKRYPFVRTTATVASEVSRRDGSASAECPGVSVSFHRNIFLKYFFNQEEYRSILLDPDNLNFETEGRPESVHILKNLAGSSKDEELIEKLKSSLLKEKEILDVEEICKSLFLTFMHKNNKSAQEVASILEKELLSRKLSKPEIIKVLFAFNETWGRVNKRSFLRMKLTQKICFSMHNLPLKQFIALFYCQLRYSKETLKLINYNVINYVRNIIPSLDSVELGIIARGLRLGNFSSYDFGLKRNFIRRTMELSGSLPEVSLCAVCKLLKGNITTMEGPELLEFQENLIPHLSKYNFNSLNRIVAVGARVGCLNMNLWEKVGNIYKEKINECNLQKVLSVISTLTECDVTDEELLKLGIERFERVVEDGTIDDLNNRKYLILFLNNLIHHRIYPKKLLDVVFADGLKFFKPDVVYGHYTKAKYWETKCFLDMDKPEFNYNSFSEEEAAKLYKLCKFLLFNMKDTVKYYNNLYYGVKAMQTTLVDSYRDAEKVYFSTWHPIYPRGLFLRFDQNLNAQPIPDDFKSLQENYPRKSLKDDHIWAFVYLLSMKYSSETEFKLTAQTQVRHVQAFGYKSIPVHYNTLRKHVQDNTVNEYMNNLMNKHLHKNA